MRFLQRTLPFGVIFLLTLLAVPVRAQRDSVNHAAETSARVQELESFHRVIFALWHDAWPKKDVAALSRLFPEIKQGVTDVAHAKLPGILREKKALWDERVAVLQTIADDYGKAVAANDSIALLDAGERLHTQYETLVRTIRPVLKEADQFHATLYVLYHYDLPALAMDRIRSSAAELKVKMAGLDKAALPPRLVAKQEAFATTRTRLSEAVDALQKTVISGNETEVKAAVTRVHTEYEALEHIFE